MRCIIYETEVGLRNFEITSKTVDEWRMVNPAMKIILTFTLANKAPMKKVLNERLRCKVSPIR